MGSSRSVPHLQTGDFYRVRIGIGRPPGRQPAADYVLSTIPAALREDYAVAVARAADACEALITKGLVRPRTSSTTKPHNAQSTATASALQTSRLRASVARQAEGAPAGLVPAS